METSCWLKPTVVPIGTLRGLPYPGAGGGEAQVVEVSAHQWYWQLSTNTVLANRPVSFEVSSADVNHGFGIYNEERQLLAQVQAMPEHPTRLTYTFEEPGSYLILCLEYCGLVHHGMAATLNVTEEG